LGDLNLEWHNKNSNEKYSIAMEIATLHNEGVAIAKKLAGYTDGLVGLSHRALRRKLTKGLNRSLKSQIYARLALMDRSEDIRVTISRLEHLQEKLADGLGDSDIRHLNEESANAAALGVGTAVPSDEKHENLLEVLSHQPEYGSGGEVERDDFVITSSLDMANFLRRPVEIANGSVAHGDYLDVRVNPWDLLTKKPSVRAKLKNYAYLKANLRFKIVFSATPHWKGKILVSYQPWHEINATLNALEDNEAIDSAFYQLLLAYLSQAPGSHVMDIKDSIPFEFLCPYLSPKPMHRLFNTQVGTAIGGTTSFADFAHAGAMYVTSFSPLYDSMDTGQEAYYQMYAWFEDVELAVNTATVLALTTESEFNKGPVERVASSVAYYAGIAAKYGILTPYAKATELFARGISGAASVLGFSRPIMTAPVKLVKTVPRANPALTIGADTAYKVALDPMQEVTVDPSATATQFDDMLISNLASRWSYIDTFTWVNGSATMATPLWSTGVWPALATTHVNGSDTYIQPSAMAFAAAPFEFWHGDIEFMVQVEATPFYKGKLAVIWEPNVAQSSLINADFSLNKNHMLIMDIAEGSNLHFVVNWNAERPWLRMPDAVGYHETGAVPTSGYYSGFANGYISIVPFTKLQDPSATQGVYVHVFARCSNLRVNRLSTENLPRVRQLVTEAQNLTLSEPLVRTEINMKGCSTARLSQLYFGEEPLSFRALLKRYASSQVLSKNLTSTTVPRLVQLTTAFIPPNNISYGTTLGATRHPNLWDYLFYAYLGMRGSVRHRINAPNANFVGAVAYGSSVPSDTTLTSDLTEVTGFNATPITVDGAADLNVNACEFEFPMVTSNSFLFAFSNDPVEYVTEGLMSGRFNRNVLVQGVSTSTSALGTHYCYDVVAAGEDFSFMRFQGAPYFSASL